MDWGTPIAVGIIVGLLLVSAFFSGAETALTAASRARLHRLEQDGDRRAGIVNRLRERKERLIGTILLGNNLVNILASALATSLLIGYFGEAGIAYATLGMTLLVLIFAEVMPKTYAINKADQTALNLAPLLRPLVVLLGPITAAIQAVVRFTLRLFGVKIDADLVMGSTEEELRGTIDLHEGPDPEVKHERRMLRSILDLADVDVGEIMIHRSDLAMIDADAKPSKIVEFVLSSRYTRIPAWRGQPDNIVGVIHAKALWRAAGAKGAQIDKLDIDRVATKPWFVPETTSLLDQLHAFRDRHEHFALVVDEYGTLLGIVTLEDILEEIVGDITDEHDVTVAGVRPQQDGSHLVKGDVTIRDLNRQFEWRLPDKDAATIAGLVMHEAKRIPDVGQVFAFHGFRFEVMRRKKTRLMLIRISSLDEPDKPKAA